MNTERKNEVLQSFNNINNDITKLMNVLVFSDEELLVVQRMQQIFFKKRNAIARVTTDVDEHLNKVFM